VLIQKEQGSTRKHNVVGKCFQPLIDFSINPAGVEIEGSYQLTAQIPDMSNPGLTCSEKLRNSQLL